MIEVRELVKKFDGVRALDGATLSVPAGSVYGLVGPNGAGKSTLIRHLTGIYRQDGGSVTIGGKPVWENAALKARIAAIPDDWYYFLQSSVRDMMRFYRGFYPTFSMERYNALKEVFQIDERRTIRRLSKGMQKQVAFWLALSCMPDYLILDEPVDGLEMCIRDRLWGPGKRTASPRSMQRPWVSSISPKTIIRPSWAEKGRPLAGRNTASHRAKLPSPDTRTMPMAVGEAPVAMAAMTSMKHDLLSENREAVRPGA